MAARKSTAPADAQKPEIISDILRVSTGTFECCILGTSPLVCNRLSEKAKHELLMPGGRKTATQKALTLKHSPIDEYRASPHRIKNDDAPTLIAMPATAFKGALRTAALDIPGAKKAQIGRLTWIGGEYVGIYGVPKLFMAPVRSADMNKTPDIRTRAILPRWACVLTVTFVQPLIRAQAIANLLAAAGLTIGVGDGRPEKGTLSYGQFQIVDRDDPMFMEVLASGGRSTQVEALDNPVCYDDESTELLSWFDDERSRRALRGVA